MAGTLEMPPLTLELLIDRSSTLQGDTNFFSHAATIQPPTAGLELS
jgi:hypothetical protein